MIKTYVIKFCEITLAKLFQLRNSLLPFLIVTFNIKPNQNSFFNGDKIRHKSSYRKCSIIRGILKISQNSQENTLVGVSFLMKFVKKELDTDAFL